MIGKRFNVASLSEKEDSYSHLNMGGITDADYAHAKRVCKDFKVNKLGEYHDLYLQSDILLLPDVIENLRNMCLEIYEIDPDSFLTASKLAWKAALTLTSLGFFDIE